MASLNLLRNRNFIVKDNVTDHVDGQQLGYLSEPQAIFITTIRTSVRGYAKALRRVESKTFDDLLECAEANRPLL